MTEQEIRLKCYEIELGKETYPNPGTNIETLAKAEIAKNWVLSGNLPTIEDIDNSQVRSVTNELKERMWQTIGLSSRGFNETSKDVDELYDRTKWLKFIVIALLIERVLFYLFN